MGRTAEARLVLWRRDGGRVSFAKPRENAYNSVLIMSAADAHLEITHVLVINIVYRWFADLTM
jgi:hypothetical protein